MSGPLTTDGRNIDRRVAELSGEAAHQKALTSEPATQSMTQTWTQLPEPSAATPTYYDWPMLKEPVWKLYYIPTYYFVGGAAGAALALGAAAQLDGSEELDSLIRLCHWTGIIGSSIGAALLILDLGRPSRFLYMLRVFRPTSAMNMGAWILAVTPTAAVTAGLFVRSSAGGLRKLGEAAGYTAGIFGLALASYTGVLVAGSAIPFWQESRRSLPILFGASAVASAGSVGDIFAESTRAVQIIRMYGIAGRIAELAAAQALEHQVRKHPGVGKPLRDGVTLAMWRGAEVLTGASLILLFLPRQNRRKRVIAGVLGSLGSLLMRYAVHQCGVRSARDPRASFELQRAGSLVSDSVTPDRKALAP